MARGANETVITGTACGHVKASKCAETCGQRFGKLKHFFERRPNLREPGACALRAFRLRCSSEIDGPARRKARLADMSGRTALE